MKNILNCRKYTIFILFYLISIKITSSNQELNKSISKLDQEIFNDNLKNKDKKVDAENMNSIENHEYSNSEENNKSNNYSASPYHSTDVEEDDTDFNSSEIVAMISYYIITVLIFIITMLFINQKL